MAGAGVEGVVVAGVSGDAAAAGVDAGVAGVVAAA